MNSIRNPYGRPLVGTLLLLLLLWCGSVAFAQEAKTDLLVPNVSEFLSLRATPSTSGSVVAKLYPGAEMEILGWTGVFCQVRVVESGQTGYVHSGHVKAANGDFTRYPYDYITMLSDVEELLNSFDDVLECEDMATSLDGRAIPVLRFGAKDSTKHILIQGAIHGREFMSGRLVSDMLRELIEANPKGIDDVMFHVIPMLNPDGVTLSIHGVDALNSTDLASQVTQILNSEGIDSALWKANARGTDLNRNFPEGWDALPVRKPASFRFRGPAPLSEPESSAIAAYVEKYPFLATVSYHSYGSILYWQGASTPELSATTEEMAKLFGAITGYPLEYNESAAVEKGGFKDWTVGTCGIPSLTVEIGAMDSLISLEEYTGILLRNQGCWARLADWVKTLA